VDIGDDVTLYNARCNLREIDELQSREAGLARRQTAVVLVALMLIGTASFEVLSGTRK